MKSVRAFAPASIGNMSLGFDVLGAALAPIDGSLLGDWVEVTSSEAFALTVDGRFADRLPSGSQSNIVTKCYQFYNEALTNSGLAQIQVSMHLHKHLPIGSGLGSSASSIVAAFQALNLFAERPFDDNQLLKMMGELEGQISGSIHYDNVAPSFLGGISLMSGLDEKVALSLPVPLNTETQKQWYWVVCYSGLSVSTSAAREILPKELALSTGLTFGRQIGVFVDALYRQDGQMAASVMKDVIAEPYRKSLLPRFDEARQVAMHNNALSFGISGSGPTVFAAVEKLSDAQAILQWLEQNYIQNDDGFGHICHIDESGARQLD